MSWQTIDIEPALGPFQGVLQAVRTVAEVGLEGLKTLEPIIDGLEAALGALAGESLILDALVQYAPQVLVVHQYPATPYQAMRFSTWAPVVQRSFELSSGGCVAPPATMLAFVIEDDDIGELVERMLELQDLFGRRPSGALDAPQTLDRIRVRALPAQCRSFLDQIPYLGRAFELARSQIQITPPSAVQALASALQMKIAAVERRINALEELLAILADLDLPDVKVFSGEVQTISAISGVLQGSDDAPEAANYVAGTVLLADETMGQLIQGILGIAQ